MITEDYVSFETAKLLKEKGFNEPCYCFYKIENEDNILIETCIDSSNSELEKENEFICYSAPTLQMAAKWLRETYNLFPVIEPFLTEETKPKYWVYVIWNNNIPKYMQSKLNYYTPEEALESTIKYCLENLI